MSELTKPTIHLNGTSAGSLLDSYTEASSAIYKALRQLCESAPNGRDYYLQDEGALKTATEQHESRVKRLQSVIAELQELAEHVAEFR